jgi:hypothetical protein
MILIAMPRDHSINGPRALRELVDRDDDLRRSQRAGARPHARHQRLRLRERPPPTMQQGERWHGKTVRYQQRHTDVVELLPGSMATCRTI